MNFRNTIKSSKKKPRKFRGTIRNTNITPKISYPSPLPCPSPPTVPPSLLIEDESENNFISFSPKLFMYNKQRTIREKYIRKGSKFDITAIKTNGIQDWLKDIKEFKEIGRGSQSIAYHIMKDGIPYIFRKTICTDITTLENEIAMYELLEKSPYITKLLYADIPNNITHTMESYFIFSYIPGSSLSAYFSTKPSLTFKDAAEIATQLLTMIDDIHKKGVVHRDIKPENIYRDTSGRLYLFDFGISCFIREGCLSDSFVGTRKYAHPNITHAFTVRKEPIFKYTPYHDKYAVGEIISADVAPLVKGMKEWRDVIELANSIKLG